MKRRMERRGVTACGVMLFLLSTATNGSKGFAGDETRTQVAGPKGPGSLDPTFGMAGVAITEFFGDGDIPNSIAVQPDGKIILAGQASDLRALDFALARYNSDGSLDPTFGAGGKLTTEFSPRNDTIAQICLQPDWKIVAVGTFLQSVSDAGSTIVMAVCRYNSDGSLDEGFGAGGRLTLSFSGPIVYGTAGAIQPDGKIVVAGYEGNSSETEINFVVARLNQDGTLDASFGTGGMVTGPAINTVCVPHSLAIQPDGKIAVCGYSGPDNNSYEFTVARYNSDGSFDTGFGPGGFVITPFFGNNDLASDVLALADGKLVVAGSSFVTPDALVFALVRYNTDGSLDPSFGGGGKVTTAFPGGGAFPYRAALQADGKIVLAGAVSSNPHDNKTSDIAIARYNSDGSLDTTFGTNGLTTTDLFGFYDSANAVFVQPDGNIVVAATTQKTTDNNVLDFAVVRYLGGNYYLRLQKSSITAQRGTKVKVTISINRARGFTGNVTVSPPESGQGVAARPAGLITSGGTSVSFKLKIARTASTGVQQLTFTSRADDGEISNGILLLNIQ